MRPEKPVERLPWGTGKTGREAALGHRELVERPAWAMLANDYRDEEVRAHGCRRYEPMDAGGTSPWMGEGTSPWMGEGTSPWMGEGRTMQEQLSRTMQELIVEDRYGGDTDIHISIMMMMG